MRRKKLKQALINFTGWRLYRDKRLPIGWDYIHDLKTRIGIPLKIIFDVGANVGQTSFRFNDNFEESTVYSFEPIGETFDTLAMNTKMLSRVKCFNLALGDKSHEVDVHLFDTPLSVLNSLRKEAMNPDTDKTETVEVTTGDQFCSDYHIPGIDLLKIDTEGYELQVLEGFSSMICKSNIKAIYCEAGFNPKNHRNTYINDLIDYATHHDFLLYGMYEVSNNQIRSGNNYGNLLFVNRKLLESLPA